MTSRFVTRRAFLVAVSGAAGATLLSSSMAEHQQATAGGSTSGHVQDVAPGPRSSGYIPDGAAGLGAAFPLAAVQLLDSPFRAHPSRNTDYLLFVDPDRLLHTVRLQVGLASSAQPRGGAGAAGLVGRGPHTRAPALGAALP